jgi:hypothetical protein
MFYADVFHVNDDGTQFADWDVDSGEELIPLLTESPWEDDAAGCLRTTWQIRDDSDRIVAIAHYQENPSDPDHPYLFALIGGILRVFAYEETPESYQAKEVPNGWAYV